MKKAKMTAAAALAVIAVLLVYRFYTVSYTHLTLPTTNFV